MNKQQTKDAAECDQMQAQGIDKDCFGCSCNVCIAQSNISGGIDLKKPIPLEVYEYEDGRRYLVIGVFNDHSRVPQVSYIGLYEPYEKWTRPVSEWLELTENGGIRYRRISNLSV